MLLEQTEMRSIDTNELVLFISRNETHVECLLASDHHVTFRYLQKSRNHFTKKVFCLKFGTRGNQMTIVTGLILIRLLKFTPHVRCYDLKKLGMRRLIYEKKINSETPSNEVQLTKF